MEKHSFDLRARVMYRETFQLAPPARDRDPTQFPNRRRHEIIDTPDICQFSLT